MDNYDLCEACGQPVPAGSLGHDTPDECIDALAERVDYLEGELRRERGWKHPLDLRGGAKPIVLAIIRAQWRPGYFTSGGAFVARNGAIFESFEVDGWREDDGTFDPPACLSCLPLAAE
jgi:hypothetical protein